MNNEVIKIGVIHKKKRESEKEKYYLYTLIYIQASVNGKKYA